MGGKFDVFAGK